MHFRILSVSALLLLAPCLTTAIAEADTRKLGSEIERLRALPMGDVEAHGRVTIMALQAGEIAVARGLILDAPASSTNDALADVLFERWGQLDGPAAYARAAVVVSVWRPKFETSALVGWAAYEPRAAWDRLMAVSNRGADPRYGEEALLAVISEADLPLGLELYQDLMSERSCLVCNASLLTITALQRGQLALITNTIAQMAPGASRTALRDAYWDVLGRYALPRALADVGRIADAKEARAARVQLAKGWASRDFRECLNYVLANYDRETKEQTLLPIIQTWSIGAVPEDVAAVVRRLTPDFSERSLLGLLPIFARVDPAAATAWAVSLPESSVRAECLDRAMWQWARIDGEAAHAFVVAQADTETAGMLLWTYLLARVGNNTLRLSDLDDITDRFTMDWRVRLLSRISLQLADPTSNRTGSFDLGAYARWVEARRDFSEQQRTKILRPLQAPAPEVAP